MTERLQQGKFLQTGRLGRGLPANGTDAMCQANSAVSFAGKRRSDTANR
jgi:hypothetical protein